MKPIYCFLLVFLLAGCLDTAIVPRGVYLHLSTTNVDGEKYVDEKGYLKLIKGGRFEFSRGGMVETGTYYVYSGQANFKPILRLEVENAEGRKAYFFEVVSSRPTLILYDFREQKTREYSRNSH